jgi:hypothetical protein
VNGGQLADSQLIDERMNFLTFRVHRVLP